jgi:fructosamine-3-kinase
MLKEFEDPQTQYMQPTLLRAVGTYLAHVHGIELEKYGPLSVLSVMSDDPRPCGVHDSWRDYILLLLQQHAQVCLQIGAITRHELQAIEKIFVRYAYVFDDVPSVLLHGDLGNQNFISCDGLTIAGLVDWEDCMSGDPVFDIAFWGTFFRDHMLEDFLAGYQTVRSLPADFTLRYWLYYLRIALSKTVHRFYFGYTDRPGRPPASMRIQKALEHLR